MSTIQSTSWAGIDTAKLTFDAAVGHPSAALAFDPALLRNLPVRSFPRSREGAAGFLAWAGPIAEGAGTTLRIVMEATGAYSIELAAWLSELAPASMPAIANPKRTADFIKSLGIRNKTDKLEARALALYGLQRQPAAYEPLSPERAKLRSLLRYRDALVQERVAERLRAQESASSATVRKIQKRRMAQLDRDIKALEKDMHEVVQKSPELKRDIDLLTTIYGVAFLTAAVVLAEIGDLRRFARARQLTAFAGVSPRVVQSGTSRHTSHISKDGNGRVRQALYMSATTAIRGDNKFAKEYNAHRANNKPHKQALAPIMRKMLTVMRAILISENPYQAHYEKMEPACGKVCGKAA